MLDIITKIGINKDYELPLGRKQIEAFEVLENPDIEEICFGGAKGGAKTVFLCYYALWKAKQVIDILGLKPSQYPLPVGFIGRKRAVDFSDTTLETWKKMVPTEVYTIREQAKEIVIEDKAKILFGGLDDEENIRKFNSAEFVFVCIDQAEEITRQDAGMLRGTLYRFKKEIPNNFYKFVLTANPDDCWLVEDFCPEEPAKRPPNRAFVKALPSDNEFIDSKKYIQQLTEAFRHAPDLIDAYVYGIWSKMQESKFVISSELIDQAKKTTKNYAYDRLLVTCDPAWTGEQTDEIVIYVMNNEKIVDSKFMSNKDTLVTAGEIVKFVNQYGARVVTIDSIGVGAGVYDNVIQLLKGKQVKVIAVNSASTKFDEFDKSTADDYKKKYLNLRSAMWWEAGLKFADGEVMLNGDAELERELKAVKYEIKNGKIKIEDKQEIKNRLNRSPDRADCFVQGLFFLKNCPLTDSDDDWDNYPQISYQNRKAGY